MTDKKPAVQHQQDQQQFTMKLESERAFLAYELGKDGTIMVMHTEVPPAYNGQGYAALLAEAVLAYAKEQGSKVMPYCAYMAIYLRRHKEKYRDLVSPEFKLN